MHSKSVKMVFVTSIIRHRLCITYAFLIFFVKKSFLTKNYIVIAVINLTTRGPSYTCLVLYEVKHHKVTKVTEPNFENKIGGRKGRHF